MTAAILLGALLAASAQDTERSIESGLAPTKARSAHHARNRRLAHRSSGTSGETITLPDLPPGSAGGPLPNYFRNCEEPTAPRYCAK